MTKFPEQTGICFVVSEFRPGGMERLVVHLALGLARRNIPVQVICLQSPGKLAHLLTNEHIPVLALESHGSKDFRALFRLRRELQDFQPSVINLHDYASLPYVAMANLLAGRRPLLFTAHGLLYEGFNTLQARNRFFSRFLKGLSAVSDKVSDRHQEYLGWKQSVEVIPNGVPDVAVNAQRRKIVRAELGCSETTYLFLAVGNPRPEKGFGDLLDAIDRLRQEHDNVLVAIAGALNESDYCRNLLEKLEQLHLDRYCRFLGFRDDTPDLYAAADTFVLSSRSEGLPMVILEAMMAGLPVIATRVGGIPDAVEDNAMLVDAQAPAQLAEAMQKIMEDEVLRTDLASRGRNHVVDNYGVERMTDQYLEWYDSMLRAVKKEDR